MEIKHSQLRDQVSEILKKRNYRKALNSLKGITLLEIRDHKKDEEENFNCIRWAFHADNEGLRNFLRDPGLQPPNGYKETESPERRDLAIYYRRAKIDTSCRPSLLSIIPEEFRHIGIYLGDGMVNSKFRYLDVFEHKIDVVPSSYGQRVRFFSKIEK